MPRAAVYHHFFRKEISHFFRLKPNNRSWHIPFLAGLSVGIPLLSGYFFGDLRSALTASLAGLTILYMPTRGNLLDTMTTMFICCFGMIVSYSCGIIFSFNDYIAPIGFGILAFAAYYLTKFFALKPPGSFFFIMIASMAIGMPHHLHEIPRSIGLFTMGTLSACILTFLYTLLTKMSENKPKTRTPAPPDPYANLLESAIIGLFMMLSVGLGKVFRLEYPYWIPISCLAVMQGVNQYHIWKRGLHRIIGTLLGLLIAWAIFSFVNSPLEICLCIIALQIIVELLITRHYALAVVFLTPMGILLAETGSATSLDPDYLLKMRFTEIVLGSVLGGIGGWFLFNERIRIKSARNLRRTQKVLKKNPLKKQG